MGVIDSITRVYNSLQASGDVRVENWLLMKNPKAIIVIYFLYLLVVWLGPKFMRSRHHMRLKWALIPYNFALQALSIYMCYEFLMCAYLSGYSLVCQPVDYSTSPLAMRMANVCWWFFFSKVIELLDTVFFILRKKNNQISFLHVYHHSTMIINWWLGVKLIAGGQAFFIGAINSFVHTVMYGYYGLAAIGPHMQKYLWWKKYLTMVQLTQFVCIVIHTSVNMTQDCDFPWGFNYSVVAYCISLILLFSNFYVQAYIRKKASVTRQPSTNTVASAVVNSDAAPSKAARKRYNDKSKKQ